MRDLFLSVGAMKAGTTFIYNILRQHPAIYFTPEKELHYFANIYGLDNGLSSPICFSPANHSLKLLKRKKHNRLQGEILSADFRRLRLSSVLKGKFSKLGDADELRQVVLWYTDRYMSDPIDEAWFSRVFADAGDRYLADFSNYHALLDKNAWQDIRKNTPGKLRVLYVLRHPVDRLWSHHKFHHIQSGKDAAFDEFSATEAKALLASPLSAHSRYGDIAENLLTCLRAHELKFICFEDFKSNPASALMDIESFLAIDHCDYQFNTEDKVNRSSPSVLQADARQVLSEKLAPQLDKLRSLEISFPESYYV